MDEKIANSIAASAVETKHKLATIICSAYEKQIKAFYFIFLTKRGEEEGLKGIIIVKLNMNDIMG